MLDYGYLDEIVEILGHDQDDLTVIRHIRDGLIESVGLHNLFPILQGDALYDQLPKEPEVTPEVQTEFSF